MSVRRIALVTGAVGGIGRASARRLATAYDLFLTDLEAVRLDAFAHDLRRDGATVAGTLAADLGEDGRVDTVVEAARAAGPLGAVLHAAGLSPTLAGSDTILRINLIATELLLRALERALEPGLAVALIASVAGHTPLPPSVPDALAGDPLAPGFLAGLARAAGAPIAPPLAYCISKRWVVGAPRARVARWGACGARIVSISPALIDTPMGRAEIATPGAQAMLDLTPLGWGLPDDIAAAAAFLCSPDARFVTGCDLLVDGGVLPAALRASVA